MAFNSKAYNTIAYEVMAIANTAGASLPAGTALKLVSLPVTPIKLPTDQYFKVDAAGDKDEVFAIVSPERNPLPITDSNPGRVILLNAGLFPILLDTAVKKDDFTKVKTAAGKCGKIGMGDTALAQAIEDGAAGALVWCKHAFKAKP